MMREVEVLAIFGPTGIGKTALALALAERLRARGEDPVAVSADALQVYRGLEVLTGVATAAEQAQLEHRLVSILDVGETCSAGRYAQLAHAEIDGLLAAGRRPIVVGGTGLYLRAALTELALRPPPPPGLRERLQAEAERDGLAVLHARIADDDTRDQVDPRDRTRVLRALELEALGERVAPRRDSQLWVAATRRPTRLIGLTADRAWLMARIDARVDAMVAAGAQDAVLALADRAGPTASRALGFSDLQTGDVQRMKTQTRRYAKRQLTWMRKLAAVETIDVTGRDPADVAAQVLI